MTVSHKYRGKRLGRFERGLAVAGKLPATRPPDYDPYGHEPARALNALAWFVVSGPITTAASLSVTSLQRVERLARYVRRRHIRGGAFVETTGVVVPGRSSHEEHTFFTHDVRLGSRQCAMDRLRSNLGTMEPAR